MEKKKKKSEIDSLKFLNAFELFLKFLSFYHIMWNNNIHTIRPEGDQVKTIVFGSLGYAML